VAFVMTPLVVIVKLAVVWPCGTDMDAGTVAALFVDASEMVSPPVGALLLSVTVPIGELPPGTELELSVNELIVGAVTASDAVFDTPLAVAVMVLVALVA